MNDAAPFVRDWSQWICWDTIVEIMGWLLIFLNPPWSKNCQFGPWAFEQFVYHDSSVYILIDD